MSGQITQRSQNGGSQTPSRRAVLSGSLAATAGVGRLVHGHTADKLGRILIELHAPIVASRDLFTPVQQSRRKVGAEPSDGDGLAAAP